MGQTVSCVDVVQQVAPKGDEYARRGAAVVTGSTNGIGVPTVESMLSAGFDRVFATARSEAAAKALSDDLNAKLGADKIADRLVIVNMDLTDLKSVRAAADRIDRESGERGVSVLINNAGVMNTPYGATKDGLEMQIGTNHFGHVLLTDLLVPALERSGRNSESAKAGDVARVVFVSSEAHKMAPGAKGFDEATFEFDAARAGAYSGWSAYGQSKLANVLAALDFDRNFAKNKQPIAAFSLHPGVIATGLGVHTTGFSVFKVLGSPFMKTVPQGAATSVYCALTQQALANRGGYFADAAFKGATQKGQNAANAAELMQLTRAILEKKN
jgi:NAD(P)-dependent dehydrogenase (short-subunit alcohol dehydrogenase family)